MEIPNRKIANVSIDYRELRIIHSGALALPNRKRNNMVIEVSARIKKIIYNDRSFKIFHGSYQNHLFEVTKII